jgi:hypothetical protein
MIQWRKTMKNKNGGDPDFMMRLSQLGGTKDTYKLLQSDIERVLLIKRDGMVTQVIVTNLDTGERSSFGPIKHSYWGTAD